MQDGGNTWATLFFWHERKDRQFGSFNSKTEAREFYEKAKQEQKMGLFFPKRYQRCGFAKLDEVLKEYLAGFTGKTKLLGHSSRVGWKAVRCCNPAPRTRYRAARSFP